MSKTTAWTKAFYTKQAEWLGLIEIWAGISPVGKTSGRGANEAAAIERLAGPGPKRVLELGCGSGIVAGIIAEHGHTVVAVDISDHAAASARRVVGEVTRGEMSVVQGDFYEVELDGTFDVICYFDGFGIGSDADQRRLLRRISGWLRPAGNEQPAGCALIDVYSPWPSCEEDEEPYRDRKAMARDRFDYENCRGINTIWVEGREEQTATQSLRAYSPPDLRLLLEGTGLELETYEPYEEDDHGKQVPLKDAMSYLAKLVPVD
jgi:SAM-dependent methyltransferase